MSEPQKKLNSSEWHVLMTELEDATSQLTLAQERRDLIKRKVNAAIYTATKD